MTTFSLFWAFRIYDLQVGLKAELFHFALDNILRAEQYGNSDTFLVYPLGGLKYIRKVSFGEYHSLRILAGTFLKHTDFSVATAKPIHQLFAVSVPVGDGFLCDTCLYSGFGNSGRHFVDKAWVKRLRNNVFLTKAKIGASIYQIHLVWYGFLGQLGQGVYRGQFHFFIDLGSAYIQGATEDKGEPKYVIHLVRGIGAACGHDDVRTGLSSQVISNLRGRVGHSKHDRVFGHAKEHLWTYYISFGKTDKDISIFHGFFKSV